MNQAPELDPADRWRLLLGEASQSSLGACSSQGFAMDRALAWLYGRDGGDGRAADSLDRHGGSEESRLTVPEWINQIAAWEGKWWALSDSNTRPTD